MIVNNLELKKTNVISQAPNLYWMTFYLNLTRKTVVIKGHLSFPTFHVFDTLLYFFNKTKDQKYFKPVELILKKLCSTGIYDHVEGGISRYTVDDKWLIPHFEKMLYDNVQFISLLSKFLKINRSEYFINKTKTNCKFF